jgi:hypothetical protein
LRVDNKIGICQRTPECKAAHGAAYNAIYYPSHKEERVATDAAYYQSHKEDKATWKVVNAEKTRASSARRRAKVKVNMDKFDMELSVDYRKAIANDPCFYCGGPGENDDHYVSLANGGTDHWWNLVRACKKCNLSKGPKNGDEFLSQKVV